MPSRTFIGAALEQTQGIAKMHESEMANVFVYFLEMASLGNARGLFFARREIEGMSRESLLAALSLVAKKIRDEKRAGGKKGGAEGRAGEQKGREDGCGLAAGGWRDYHPEYEKNMGGPKSGGVGEGPRMPKPPKMIAGKKAEEKVAGLVFSEISSFAPADFDAQEAVLGELQKRCGEDGFRQEMLPTALLLVEEEMRFGGVGEGDFDPAGQGGWKSGIMAGGREIVPASTREMIYRYLDSHPKDAEWLAQEIGFAVEGAPRKRWIARAASKEEIAEDAYRRLKKRHGKAAAKFSLGFGLFRGRGRDYVCRRHPPEGIAGKIARLLGRK